VSRPFPSLNRSILTDIYLCHACSCQEILRTETAGQALALALAAGQTGFPMVDACMRCLLATGWLNFRMRAMLASFAAYNLWLDWRHYGKHLGTASLAVQACSLQHRRAHASRF
jgi:hypothetical protein